MASLVLLVLRLALLPGCGDPPIPDAAPTLTRLELLPADDAEAWPEGQDVGAFDLLDAQGAGPAPRVTVDAPTVRVAPMRLPGGLSVDALLLEDFDGGDPFVVRVSGRFAPGDFDELRVLATSAAPGLVSARFLRGTQSVWMAAALPLVVGADATAYAFPLNVLPEGAPPFSVLELSFEASARRVGLRRVEFVRRALVGRLPDPSRGAALFEIGGDARLAVGLSALRPLEARVLVPPDGRLDFAYARPWQVVLPGRVPALRVEVTADGVERLEASYDLDEPSWRARSLDLPSFAGRTARVRVSVDDRAGGDAACVLADACVWSPGRGPPSVLLVTSDTHRADHLGVARLGVDVRTPVLDAFAARGVLFSDCQSLTNVTNPSHIAIMTGIPPRDTGIDRNNQPLAPAASTLAEAFASAGYTTLAFVSARHLGDPSSGLGQGFDRMAWPVGRAPRAADTVAHALDALDGLGARPVFAWVHVFDAHTPYDPPEDDRELYWPDDRDPYDAQLPAPDVEPSVVAEYFDGLRDLAYPPAMYKGEVTSLDAALDELLSLPRFVGGITAVTADHGESLGQHGIWYTHAGLFRDTIHVPLLLAWPGCPAGRRVDAPVSHADLASTLLDLAGLPASLGGRSLRTAVDGDWREEPRFALSANGFSASVTDHGLQLLLWLRPQKQRQMSEGYEQHEVRLFDLRVDPECEHDLSVARHDDAAALRRLLVDWMLARQDLGLSGTTLDDPSLLENLRQLGYVAGSDAPGPTLWVEDGCARCRAFQSPPR
ncbi:MAG: sulfatase [Planctomycetes bacterium]|nr:sulfatase [Planctomycetota bacterium]